MNPEVAQSTQWQRLILDPPVEANQWVPVTPAESEGEVQGRSTDGESGQQVSKGKK